MQNWATQTQILPKNHFARCSNKLLKLNMRRYLIPENFLKKAFPHAKYIFLTRDPRANISSMIEGWEQVKFQKSRLTDRVNQIEKSSIKTWAYPAPPNWESITDKPLHYICAWVWNCHVDSISTFFKETETEYELVRYEDLVQNSVRIKS